MKPWRAISNSASLLLLSVFAATSPQSCVPLSALAPPPTKLSVTAGGGGPFTAPLAEFKRYNLKKQLVTACNDKNEDAVVGIVEALSELNPNRFGTYGLGGYGVGDAPPSRPPLDGEWRLLFTNAKDAEAPARSDGSTRAGKFGDGEVAPGVRITTGQRIDAAGGECVNYIRAEGEGRPFDRLEITIKMTALTPSRVRLDFQRGRAQNERAPVGFLKDVSFGFPPAIVGDGLALLRGKNPNVEPPAYFDILYIDQQLRAHRTGEGKIFVQMRQRP